MAPPRLSLEDLFQVKSRIESCLKLYMSREEIKETLLRDEVEPIVFESVWRDLEEKNLEFFKTYNLKLMAKDRIIDFNKHLEQQLLHLPQIQTTGIASTPTSSYRPNIPPSNNAQI